MKYFWLFLVSGWLSLNSVLSYAQPVETPDSLAQSIAAPSKFQEHYTDAEKQFAYQRLVRKGASVSYEAVADYLDNPPYSYPEMRQFLQDHGVDAAEYSDEVLHVTRLSETDFFVGVDYGITTYKMFSLFNQNPPDYHAAWALAKEKLPDITAQLGCYFISGGFCILKDAFGAVDFATSLIVAWVSDTQNKWAINNQLLFYRFYRDQWNIADPFQDDMITIDGGYLYPPSGLQYGGVVIPHNTTDYSPAVLEAWAEQNYLVKASETELIQSENDAAQALADRINPLIQQLSLYQSGANISIVNNQDHGAYIGNIGPTNIENLVLRGNTATEPFALLEAGDYILLLLPPGKVFGDFDEIEFSLFGVTVTIPISGSLKPFVGTFHVRDNDDGYNTLAPQSVYVTSAIVPDDYAYPYSIDFGDGTPIINGTANPPGLIRSPDHLYSQPGEYNVKLTIHDGQNNSSEMHQIYNLANPVMVRQPFTQSPHLPGPAPNFALNSNGAFDSTGQSITFEWDFNYQAGNFIPDAYGTSVNFGASGIGDHVVAFRASRADGIRRMVTQTLTVLNPASAVIQGIPDNGSAPFQIAADGSHSFSSSGSIVSYHWIFGDGATSDSITAHHTYNSNGTYNISLRVIDINGYADTVYHTLRLSTIGPTVYSTLNITGNTVLTKYADPYIINSSLTVQSSANLTIEPGVRIYFAPSASMNLYGRLLAMGDPGNRITFASKDTLSPDPANWTGIRFYSGSSSSLLSFATIRDADAGIQYQGGNPSMNNCAVAYSTYAAAVSIGVSPAWSQLTEMSYSNNLHNTCLILGSSVTSNWTIPTSPLPYSVVQNITVYGPSGGLYAVLRVAAGVEMQFSSQVCVQLGVWGGNWYGRGRIVVEGRPDQRVRLTGIGTPSPGTWGRIFGFRNQYGLISEYDTLLYCDLEYGGYGGTPMIDDGNGWYLEGCRISNGAGHGIANIQNSNLVNCQISDNLGDGIHVSNAAISASGCTFQNNAGYGIYAVNGIGPLSGNNFINNNAPLRFSCTSSFPVLMGNTYTNNDTNSIEVAGGNITVNSSIPDDGVPYRILGGLTVYGPSGGLYAVLRVAAGVEMQFSSQVCVQLGVWGGNWYGRGRIVVEGRPDQRVRLTGIGTPSPGTWGRIFGFRNQYGLISEYDTLLYCDLEYGGYGGTPMIDDGNGWYLEGCRISNGAGHGIANIQNSNLVNCQISDNLGDGIHVSNAAISASGCTFQNNAGYGIYAVNGIGPLSGNNFINNNAPLRFSCTSSFPVLMGNTYTNNDTNSIEVAGGNITVNSSIPDDGVPYRILGGLTVYGPSGGLYAVLRVAAGVEMQFSSQVCVQLGVWGGNWYGRGRIVVEGRPDQRVRLTGIGTPSPGTWGRIFGFRNQYGLISEYDTLLYCDLEYGGYGGTPMIDDGNGWYLEGCRISNGAGHGIANIQNSNLVNCQISDNLGDGIHVSNAAISASGCTFQNNAGYGIYAVNGIGPLSGNNFINNNAPLRFSCTSSFPVLMGNTYTNNDTNSIEVAGGNITVNSSIPDDGVPYRILGGLTVYGPSGGLYAVLRVAAGVEMQFSSQVCVQLGVWGGNWYGRGRIVVEGRPDERVRLTGIGTPSPGTWGRIFGFRNQYGLISEYDTLLYCDLEYGGYGGTPMIDDGNGWYLEGCRISNGAGHGIANISNSRLVKCNITNNIADGVRLSSGLVGTTPENGCDIHGNGGFNLAFTGGGILNAEYNYWGSTDSATIASKISGNVDYIPWAESSYCNDGEINGTVSEVGGPIIEGALIRVLQDGVEISVDTTDQRGYYCILNLLPGNYDVEASKAGYTSQVQEHAEAVACETNPFHIQLPIYSPFCDNFAGLFCDGFDNGESPLWTSLAGNCTWSVINGAYNSSNSGQNQLCLKSVLNPSWSNYVFQVDIRGNAGVDKEIAFRSRDGLNTYDVNLVGNPTNELHLNKVVNGVSNRLVGVPFSNRNGIWYHLRVACIGQTISVFVNGNQLIQYTDNNNPFLHGGIGLVNWTGAAGICDVSFDNVGITEPPLGVDVDYIEVNQGLADSLITLIPGKDIAIRTYLMTSNSSPIYDVTGNLHILRGGMDIPGSPFSPYPTTMIVKSSYSEADLDEAKNSLNFYFDSLSAGPYEAYLVVNGQESQHKNFEVAGQALLTNSIPEIRLLIQPITDRDGDGPDLQSLYKQIDFLNDSYPLGTGRIKCEALGGKTINMLIGENARLNNNDRLGKAVLKLWRYLDEWNFKKPLNKQCHYIIGVLDEGNLQSGTQGMGWNRQCGIVTGKYDGNATINRISDSVILLSSKRIEVLAHELGHKMGLGDEYEGTGVRTCPQNLPAQNCKEGLRSFGNFVDNSSYSPREKTIKFTSEAGYQSTCRPFWLHKSLSFMGSNGITWSNKKRYHWITQEVRTTIKTSLETGFSQPGNFLLADQNMLSLYGSIHIPDSSGSFEPVFDNRISEFIPNLIGAYSIELFDNSGNLLTSQHFDLGEAPLPEPSGEAYAQYFNVLVPYDNSIAKIILRHFDVALDSLVRSTNQPSITIISPLNGATLTDSVQIIWSGNDADSDSLTYTVSIENDTLSLPVVFKSQDTSTYIYINDLYSLDSAYIVIKASDGLNTTADSIKCNLISIDRLPIINIISPGDSVITPNHALIIFSANANDYEDGALYDSVLVWNSSINGEIGKGKRLETDSLSPGQHFITLTGHDSYGHVVSDSITLTIVADSDNDGMPDAWERTYGLDTLENDSQNDNDHDSLVNIDEYHWNTNPRFADTDNDGFPDGIEIKYGSSPIDSSSIPFREYAFNIVAPDSDKIATDPNITFVWHSSTGREWDTLTYNLYYSTDSLFANADSITGIADTTALVVLPSSTNLYWWYVAVRNRYGYGVNSSQVFKFYLSLDSAILSYGPAQFGRTSLVDSIAQDTLNIYNTGLGFLEVNLAVEDGDSIVSPLIDLKTAMLDNNTNTQAIVEFNQLSDIGNTASINNIKKTSASIATIQSVRSQNIKAIKTFDTKSTGWLNISLPRLIIPPTSQNKIILTYNTSNEYLGHHLNRIVLLSNDTNHDSTAIDVMFNLVNPLTSFDLKSPDDGDTVSNDTLHFIWSKSNSSYAGDSLDYELYLSNDQLFADADSFGPVSDTSLILILPGLQDSTQYWWRVKATSDSVSIPRWSLVPRDFVTLFYNCSYMQGDINSDGQRIGGDVTYGVRYFKGIGAHPLDSCYMDSTGSYLFVAGDVNGNCEFRGSDITRLVAYFKGTAVLSYCHFFPPPSIKSVIPAEIIPFMMDNPIQAPVITPAPNPITHGIIDKPSKDIKQSPAPIKIDAKDVKKTAVRKK